MLKYSRKQLEEMADKTLGHFDIKAHARYLAGKRALPVHLRLNGTTKELIDYCLQEQNKNA